MYWESVFVFPYRVIHEVESALRAFIWRRDLVGRGGSKVCWDDVCFPHSEDGLGLRHLLSWTIIKLFWLLIVCARLLWVAWVEEYVLRGHSIWLIRPSP